MRTLLGLLVAALALMPVDMQAQVVFQERRFQGLTPDVSTLGLFPATVSYADQPDLLHISTGTRRLAALDNLTSGPLTMRDAQERGAADRILIGAGIGLVSGFALGWVLDLLEGEVVCLVSDPCQLSFRDSDFFWPVSAGAVGTGLGAAMGWLIETPADRPPRSGPRRGLGTEE